MIGRKIIIQFFGVGLSSILGFFTLSLTARFFGPSLLGELNYFLGILGLILLFSDLGFSRAHIKFIADKKNISPKIGVFLSIKSVLLFIFLLAALFYFYFFLRQETSSIKSLAFFILLFYEFFYRFGSSILISFEGLQLVAVQNIVLNFGKLAKLIGIIFFLFFAKNIIGLSLSYLLEALAVLILSAWFIRRFFPLSWSTKVFKKYFYYTLPFFVIFPLSYIQGNIDVIILRNFWTASAVGYYAAAIGLTAFVKSLYGVLITLFFPKISQLYSKGQLKKIQQYTDLTIKYLLIFFIPVFLALYIFRNELIILVLGQDFMPSIEIFSLSLIGIFILMISSPYDHLLYATGKHKILVPLAVATVSLSIILQLIFVPKTLFSLNMFSLGAEGTVLANIIVWFISAVVEIYLVFKFFKIKPFSKGLAIFLIGFLIFLVYSFLGIGNLFFAKILFLIAGLSVFYFSLKYLGIIASSDVKYMRIILNPKKIAKEGVRQVKNNE